MRQRGSHQRLPPNLPRTQTFTPPRPHHPPARALLQRRQPAAAARPLPNRGTSATTAPIRPRAAAAPRTPRGAALQQDDLTPRAVMAADAFAGADDAEAGAPVQGEAGGVLGEDPGLDGPHPGGLGRGDQGVQEYAGDAAAAGVGVDVYGVLDHARVCAPVRNGARGHPPQHGAARGQRSGAGAAGPRRRPPRREPGFRRWRCPRRFPPGRRREPAWRARAGALRSAPGHLRSAGQERAHGGERDGVLDPVTHVPRRSEDSSPASLSFLIG